MAERMMTLVERLRNPQFGGHHIDGEPILDGQRARDTMDEAAKHIENLEKAIALRHEELVMALKWLGRRPAVDIKHIRKYVHEIIASDEGESGMTTDMLEMCNDIENLTARESVLHHALVRIHSIASENSHGEEALFDIAATADSVLCFATTTSPAEPRKPVKK